MLEQNEDQMSKDDADWFAILGGQSVPDANPETARKARALRAALLSQTETAEKPSEARLQAIKKRLATAGYLKPSSVPQPTWLQKVTTTFSELFQWKYVPFAAVYTLVVVVMVNFIPHLARGTRDDVSTTEHLESKGAEEETVEKIYSKSPQAEAQHLFKDLSSIEGVKPEITENIWQIEATKKELSSEGYNKLFEILGKNRADWKQENLKIQFLPIPRQLPPVVRDEPHPQVKAEKLQQALLDAGINVADIQVISDANGTFQVEALLPDTLPDSLIDVCKEYNILCGIALESESRRIAVQFKKE